MRQQEHLRLGVDLGAPPAGPVQRSANVGALVPQVDLGQSRGSHQGARRAEVAAGREPDRVADRVRGPAERRPRQLRRIGWGRRAPVHDVSVLVHARVAKKCPQLAEIRVPYRVQPDPLSDQRLTVRLCYLPRHGGAG